VGEGDQLKLVFLECRLDLVQPGPAADRGAKLGHRRAVRGQTVAELSPEVARIDDQRLFAMLNQVDRH